MNANLSKLMDFVRFTHEIRNVQRAIMLETEDRHENDEEHMYQTALVAWFIIENDKLPLDPYRCVGLAMVHDIAEAYAGDTIAFASKKDLEAQKDREEKAIERLQKEWPGFTSLHQLIHEYEEHTTPEAKFVYALDKLIPIINNYLYEGRVWHKEGITLEMLKAVKVGKIDISPQIAEYNEALMQILENSPEIFGKPKND